MPVVDHNKISVLYLKYRHFLRWTFFLERFHFRVIYLYVYHLFIYGLFNDAVSVSLYVASIELHENWSSY
jgi:hypothetical protein